MDTRISYGRLPVPDGEETPKTLKHRAWRKFFKMIGTFVASPLTLPHEKVATNEVDRSLERMRTAEHESGHLLAALIKGTRVTDTYVSRYSKQIQKVLGLSGGWVTSNSSPDDMPTNSIFDDSDHFETLSDVTVSGRQLHQERADDKALYRERYSDPVIAAHELFSDAAGLIAQGVLEGDRDSLERFVTEIAEIPSTHFQHDFGRVRFYILQHTPDGDSETVAKKMTEICSILYDFFSRPNVVRVLHLLSADMMQNHKMRAHDLSQYYRTILSENGITAEEWATIISEYGDCARKVQTVLRGIEIPDGSSKT